MFACMRFLLLDSLFHLDRLHIGYRLKEKKIVSIIFKFMPRHSERRQNDAERFMN